jgi:hypothetical protein
MRWLVLAALLAAACREDPTWARMPTGIAGEATLSGEPAAVPRIAAPALDGKLDDWQGAATLGPLVDPGDGSAASGSPVAGFARLGWSDTHLYLGMLIRDDDPRSPFSRDAVDPHVWAEASGIELMLQPGDRGDNRDYFEIQVDVAGAVWDTRFDDYNAPIVGQGAERRFGHQDWRSGVERAVHVEKGRFWSVEVALPWSAIRPPAPGEVWRLNLYTFRDGQRAALAWSPLRGQGNFHRTSRWGRVRFE